MRHCRVCDDFHLLENWPNACRSHFAARGPRSEIAAPTVIRDGMDPIRSMADGKMYDGKGAYYRAVRAAGCEIVGNERAPFERQQSREFVPDPVGPDIKRALEELAA